jgi:small subunit ribosomal protein S26
MHWFREEVKSKEAMITQTMTVADEEAEFERCKKINDEWNFEISKIRDARLAVKNAEMREHIKTRLELKAIREIEKLEKIEEVVKKEKQAAVTFITRDNIDKAIEEALANPVDFNFAVDSKGAVFSGSESLGKAPKPEA